MVMPRFAANLSMLFTEYPVVERFDRAAAAGFKAVEFLFPYAEDVDGIRAALDRNGIEQILFNLPVGDFAAGDRGMANNPAKRAEFADGVSRAIEIATKLGVGRINCLVGKEVPGVSRDVQWGTLKENLAMAAERLQSAGIMQVLEPLNPYDAPGYFIPTPSLGFKLVEEIDHPNLFLEYDIYHAQRTEGNLTRTIQEKVARIGHVQIADSPARNEPGTGEINYPFVLAALDEAGYDGWVGLEYKPSGPTETTLGWLRDWGYWT
jgi:hydroxypyruvate isomerase